MKCSIYGNDFNLIFSFPENTAGGTLDDTAAYFDLGPVPVTSPAGIYYYFSTRNNAFTNRDQKASVVVYPSES